MLAAIERGKLVKRKEKWPDAQKIICRPNLQRFFIINLLSHYQKAKCIGSHNVSQQDFILTKALKVVVAARYFCIQTQPQMRAGCDVQRTSLSSCFSCSWQFSVRVCYEIILSEVYQVNQFHFSCTGYLGPTQLLCNSFFNELGS